MRIITRIKRSTKAISPVISVLLMIAIAVAASLIAYAWIMGYIGGTTSKVGKAVLIQSMAPTDDGKLVVYVQNVGMGAVKLGEDSSYVDDVLREILEINGSPLTPGQPFTLDEGKTAAILLNFDVAPGDRIKVRIVTTDGTFTEANSGTGGGTSVLPAALDHFDFSAIGSQTAGVPFSVTITAKDQYGNTFTGYTGTNDLSVSAGTIDPVTADLVSGVWTGDVVVIPAGTGVTILTSGSGKSGTTDPFNIGKASSTTSTQLSALSVVVGDSVTDTATVTPSAATGSVTFQYSTDSGNTWNDLGSPKPLSSGQATSDSYMTTGVGIVYFRAIYGGDASYLGSQSGDTDEALTVDPVPFGLDGSAIASATSGSSFTISLTTNRANDLLYISVVSYDNPVSSITGGGLTFSQRAASPGWSYSGHNTYFRTWWAVSPSSGTITITVTLSGSTSGASAVAFGVSGANTASPFDGAATTPNPNSGNPISKSTPSATPSANDMVIGAIGIVSGTSSPPTLTLQSGFTPIGTATQNSGSCRCETSNEYKIVSSAGPTTVGYSWSGSYGYALIADAIKQAP